MITKNLLRACFLALALSCLTSAYIINHDGHPSAPSTTKPPPTTTTKPIITCTSTATATWFSTSGCDIPCGTSRACIADYAVTLPCGCDRISVSVTTTTVCPKVSPCMQCVTGWGIYTYHLPCPTRPSSLPAPPLVTSVMPAA